MKLPPLRRDTQIKSLLSHELYINNDTMSNTQSKAPSMSHRLPHDRHHRSLNTHNSVANLGQIKNIVSSSMSKNTKYSSQHSHTKSSVSFITNYERTGYSCETFEYAYLSS